MNKRTAAAAFFFAVVLGFLLNFFWETLHGAFLYERQWADEQSYVLLILRASLGDAMYLGIMYALGAFAWKDALWVRHFTARKALFTVFLGLVAAAFIEYKGVYLLGKWSYADAMPVVGGVGASPLLQLAATGVAAFFISGLFATITDKDGPVPAGD